MNIIRKRRKELGLSQQDIEDKTGISRERIGRLENGEQVMRIDDLKTVCKLLGIEWEFYYQNEDIKTIGKL